MAFTTPNMGLKIWNLITDLFSHSDLASNLATMDTHDHSNGKGVQINSAGIAPLAITAGKIASGSITSTQLAAAVQQMMFAPGDLKASAISAAPTGWLLCDGSAVLRSTFSALFSAIGTSYGTGDGSTTFNVPDLRGRAMVGAGTGAGLTARTIGNAGGAETQTLNVGQIPDHHHLTLNGGGIVPGLHANVWAMHGITQGTDETVASSTDFSTTLVQSGVTSLITDVFGTGNGTGTNGVANAHANMQPYAVVNVFIKA